ncbi:hypothetical protein [Flagellimonas aurea]|uniref:hypothetical protein n=1 Tax=Flagellimonas aurea TaxID=2915619 RepID=UPI0035D0000B
MNKLSSSVERCSKMGNDTNIEIIVTNGNPMPQFAFFILQNYGEVEVNRTINILKLPF